MAAFLYNKLYKELHIINLNIGDYLNNGFTFVSLGDENNSNLEKLIYNLAITYKDKIEEEVDKTLLKASIKKLSNRERNIMELRFGFISGKEKTQKEVADMLGISQSYISRLEKKIIVKMKKDIMSKTG